MGDISKGIRSFWKWGDGDYRHFHRFPYAKIDTGAEISRTTVERPRSLRNREEVVNGRK